MWDLVGRIKESIQTKLVWSENTALEKIFGPKTAEVAGDWIKLHSHELHWFVRFTRRSGQGGWAWWPAWLRKDMHTDLSWRLLKERWVANLKTDLKEIVYDSVLEARIGTSDWLLWARSWTSWLHTLLGISSQTEEILASQEIISSIELVREVTNDGDVYFFSSLLIQQYVCCVYDGILHCKYFSVL